MELDCLNPNEKKVVSEFIALNSKIFENPVVISFFSNKETLTLLAQSILGNVTSKEVLDDEFKNHFFKIRFTKFVSSTLRFYTIGYARKIHKNRERNLLVLDNNIENNSDDEFLFQHSLLVDDYFTNVEEFEQNIEDENLFAAWKLLKPHQRSLAILSFVKSYKDIEIAKLLGVTPQAIYKNKKSVLKTLRSNYLRKENVLHG